LWNIGPTLYPLAAEEVEEEDDDDDIVVPLLPLFVVLVFTGRESTTEDRPN
jgi:hypothetical protein